MWSPKLIFLNFKCLVAMGNLHFAVLYLPIHMYIDICRLIQRVRPSVRKKG